MYPTLLLTTDVHLKNWSELSEESDLDAHLKSWKGSIELSDLSISNGLSDASAVSD